MYPEMIVNMHAQFSQWLQNIVEIKQLLNWIEWNNAKRSYEQNTFHLKINSYCLSILKYKYSPGNNI